MLGRQVEHDASALSQPMKRTVDRRTQKPDPHASGLAAHDLFREGAGAIGSETVSRVHAGRLSRFRGSTSTRLQGSVLRLQQHYGNRYMQRVVGLSREAGGEAGVGADVESAIERKRGGGQMLDRSVRSQMESAFGVDFTGVRVHTDSEANSLNHTLGARAFTIGRDIFFSHGEYRPESSGGLELLAHELTHVVQQDRPAVQGKLTVSHPDDLYEQEADRVAKAVVRHIETGGQPPVELKSEEPQLHRTCTKCEEQELQAKATRGGARKAKMNRSRDARGGTEQGQCPECRRRANARGPEGVQPQSKTLDQIARELSSESRPLDLEVRLFMENRLGADLSNVKVHTNEKAQAAARTLRADAFTIGSHIFFSPGQYNPHSKDGMQLIAHELVHVLQQGNPWVSLQASEPSAAEVGALEAQADLVAQGIQGVPLAGMQGSRVQRSGQGRLVVPSTPLVFLLRRRPGQGYLDCINECTSNSGFSATMGGILAGICGVVAVLAAAAATPETGGAATAPAAVGAAAFCAGFALGIPTGIMASCMWECR